MSVVPRWLARLPALVLLSTLACAPSGQGAAGGASNELRVAVAGPFSGDAAQYGQDFLRGAGLAADKLNATGGVQGKQIKLVQFDDRNDTTEAANVAQRLATDSTIVASMGHFTSSTVYAAMPIYKANALPLVVISASDPKITQQGNEWLFRVSPTNNLGAEVIADLMVNQLGHKQIAAFYLNTDYGKSEHAYFLAEVQKDGGEVVLEEGYQPDAKDFSASLIKLKTSGARAVHLSSYYNDAALLIKQAQAAGLEPQWFASTGVVSPAFAQVGGSAVEGVISDRIAQAGAWDEVANAYREKYNQDASPFVVYAYSSLQAIAESARGNAATRQGIRDGLAKLKELPTGIGPLTFDPNRQVIYSNFEFLIVKEGQFQPWKP